METALTGVRAGSPVESRRWRGDGCNRGTNQMDCNSIGKNGSWQPSPLLSATTSNNQQQQSSDAKRGKREKKEKKERKKRRKEREKERKKRWRELNSGFSQ